MLFNAMAKVPMQFFILFVGAMVFVFYLFAHAAYALRADSHEGDPVPC